MQRRVVAFLEGRRSTELASLIERHNGVPLAAPCLREVHSPDAPELQASILQALEADLDVAIFLTGVGTTTVFEAARHMGREADLRAALGRRNGRRSRAKTDGRPQKAGRAHRRHRAAAQHLGRSAEQPRSRRPARQARGRAAVWRAEPGFEPGAARARGTRSSSWRRTSGIGRSIRRQSSACWMRWTTAASMRC